MGIKKRYQVFVSSTYLDMKEERQAAVEAILGDGHIPAGMELFVAGDESQWETIKKWIDESDVYMLILGGRYGSIKEGSGLSYIEHEYDYAVEQGKPLFTLVMDDKIMAKRGIDDTTLIEKDNPQKYSEFRKKLLGKMSAIFSDHKDIKIKTKDSLRDIEHRKGENIVGWVRADSVVPAVQVVSMGIEATRLSQENNELRARLSVFSDKDRENAEFEELLEDLSKISIQGNNVICVLEDLGNKLVDGISNSFASIHSIPISSLERIFIELDKRLIVKREKDNFGIKTKLTDKGKSFVLYLGKKHRDNEK